MSYTWAVDGYERKFIVHRSDDHRILLCVIPGESVWDCIDALESQEEALITSH